VEAAHVGCTAGTWSHHIVIVPKQFVELLGEWPRHVLEACVAHRLAAASLAFGVVNVEANGA
jgi:hypothetical protein